MDPADTASDSQAPAAEVADTRGTRRESLFIGVEILRGGALFSGRIRNISATGALIETDSHFTTGDHLILSFRGVGTIGATIVRKTAKGGGVRFDTEIDPAVCRINVTASQDTHPAWLPPPTLATAARFKREGVAQPRR
ncbi:MAG TPA: PilZ domain-containing protein [Sphingomonas sp.]